MFTRIYRHPFLAHAGCLIFALSLFLTGCEKKAAWQEPGPAATFEGFLMDWFRGDREAAFDTLVESDRKALSAPLAELEAALDAEPLPSPADMLVVGRVNNPYDFKSIELLKPLESAPEPGQSVELVLNFHDGHQGRAKMVWDGERWLVDLPLETAGAAKDENPSKSPGEVDVPEAKIPEANAPEEDTPEVEMPEEMNPNPTQTPPKAP